MDTDILISGKSKVISELEMRLNMNCAKVKVSLKGATYGDTGQFKYLLPMAESRRHRDEKLRIKKF